MVQPRLLLVGLLLCLLPGCGSGHDVSGPLPVGIELPAVGTLGREPRGPGTIVVDVTAEGRISIGGKGPLGLADLRDELIRLTRAKGWRESDGSSLKILHVRADRRLPWSVSQWVMQIAADPRIQLYRIFFGAQAEGSGLAGALGWRLPAGRPLNYLDPLEIPRVRVLMQGDDGPASRPEDLLPALHAAAGDRPLRELQLTLAGPPLARNDVPTGFVVRLVDVALRAGVGDIEFEGRMPSLDALDAEGLVRHVAEVRGSMGAPRLVVGGKAVPALSRSVPLAPSAGRRRVLIGCRVEKTEPGPSAPEDEAPGDADEEQAGDLEEALEEAESWTPPPFDGVLPALDTSAALPRRKGAYAPREDVVERALRWLAAAQRTDGGWTATPGSWSDVGVTGLALSAFLGAGYTNRGDHEFARVVAKGLRYLKNVQDAGGCFGRRSHQHYFPNHAPAALAMVEAYGMTASPIFKTAAQKSLDHLLALEVEAEGAVEAAFIAMPLASARHVNAAAVEGGKRAPLELGSEEKLRDRLARLAGLGASGTDPTEIVAAAWLDVLCHQTMPEALPVNPGMADAYYWHFGALVAHQLGGDTWKRWNQALDAAVRGTQRTDGRSPVLIGSWDPVAGGERTVTTALLAMALEAPYRYERVR